MRSEIEKLKDEIHHLKVENRRLINETKSDSKPVANHTALIKSKKK